MQHFTAHELDWLEDYMKEEFLDDIPEKITHLQPHSDNAGSHLKSTGAIQLFTSLVRDRGGPIECMYVYTFGSPGYGKGFFDCVGGTLKNKIHTLIQATKTLEEGIAAGTDDGYIQSPEDVHDALKHYFETDYSATCRKNGKTKPTSSSFLSS